LVSQLRESFPRFLKHPTSSVPRFRVTPGKHKASSFSPARRTLSWLKSTRRANACNICEVGDGHGIAKREGRPNMHELRIASCGFPSLSSQSRIHYRLNETSPKATSTADPSTPGVDPQRTSHPRGVCRWVAIAPCRRSQMGRRRVNQPAEYGPDLGRQTMVDCGKLMANLSVPEMPHMTWPVVLRTRPCMHAGGTQREKRRNVHMQVK
jgi:hypothetical protein